MVPSLRVGAGDLRAPSSDQVIAVVPLGPSTVKTSVLPAGSTVITGAVLAATLGVISLRLLALRPTDSPAAVRVSTWRTSGVRPFATHVTSTAIRLRSAGCGSAVF